MEMYGDGSSDRTFQIESTTGTQAPSGGDASHKSVATLPRN